MINRPSMIEEEAVVNSIELDCTRALQATIDDEEGSYGRLWVKRIAGPADGREAMYTIGYAPLSLPIADVTGETFVRINYEPEGKLDRFFVLYRAMVTQLAEEQDYLVHLNGARGETIGTL